MGLRRVFAAAVVAVALGAGAAPAMAVDNTFNGSVSNDWNDPANWSLGHPPLSTEDVKITGIGKTALLGSGADGQAKSVTVAATNSLTVSGKTLSVGTGASSITGAVTVASSGTITVAGALDNDGAVSVQSGTFELSTGDAGSTTGSYDVSAAGILKSSGPIDNRTFPNVTGAGKLLIAGGAVIIPSGATFTIANVEQPGGQWYLNTNASVSSYTTSGGVGRYGTGTLTITGTSSLSGLIDLQGPIVVAASATSSTIDGSSIENGGTLTLNHDTTMSGNLTVSAPGQLTVASGKTLSLSGDVGINSDGSVHVLGSIVKASGAGTSSIGPTVDNDGTISAQTGTLDLSGPDAGSTTGGFTASAGATLQLSGPFASTRTLPSVTGAGKLSISGGINTVPAGSTFTIPTVEQPGGHWHLNTNASVSSYTTSGGVGRYGTGTLTITGTSSLTGLIDLQGPIVVAASATSSTIDGSSIENGGTLTLNHDTTLSGSGLTVDDTGKLTVNATLTLTGQISMSGGTVGGTGTLAGSLTNNDGTVAPGTSPGALTITGDYTQGGGGTLKEEITGAALGAFDRLIVGGDVSLAGTLAIDSTTYDPFAADTFKIIGGADSRTGSFSSVTGATVGSATYVPQYDSDGVTLAVSGGKPPAPSNTTAPSLPTTRQAGQSATCDTGQWTNSPTSFAFSWTRDGSTITGQQGTSYVPVAGDVGHTIRCVVVAHNAGGDSSPATSNGMSVTNPGPTGPPVNLTKPSIPATGKVNQVVTCNPGTWTQSPTSFAFSWTIDDSLIANQHGKTYRLAAGDAAHRIRCQVVAHNAVGNSAPATSNALTVKRPNTGCTDRTPPKSAIKTKSLANGTLKLTGTASDPPCNGKAGKVVRVIVTIALHLDPSKGKNRCRFLLENGRTLGPVRGCDGHPAIVFPAKGTAKWILKMPAKPPKGKYTIRSLATDASGNVQKVSRKGPNVIKLTVR